jgi:Raf kinase inhibitor-like YbhB/YbcL family protein
MLAYKQISIANKVLEVSSPAFIHGAFIPKRHTCDGQNEAPELIVNWIPIETKSLAIIVDDPDAPVNTWVHWIAWNIHPKSIIKPNRIKGRQGLNDFGIHRYCGPCPPNGVHHYHFKVYALDNFLLELNNNSNKYQLEKAMKMHILAFGELIGLYKRL